MVKTLEVRFDLIVQCELCRLVLPSFKNCYFLFNLKLPLPGEGVQQSLLKIIEGTIVTVNDKAKNKSVQV